MSTDEREPYLQLLGLIERDLSLAGEGRYDELVAADVERQALISTLPATPPAAARDLLERATLIQKRLNIELLRGREQLVVATGLVERGRRTARGYTPPINRVPRVVESA
jgi:type VI protein secretion system component VasF